MQNRPTAHLMASRCLAVSQLHAEVLEALGPIQGRPLSELTINDKETLDDMSEALKVIGRFLNEDEMRYMAHFHKHYKSNHKCDKNCK